MIPMNSFTSALNFAEETCMEVYNSLVEPGLDQIVDGTPRGVGAWATSCDIARYLLGNMVDCPGAHDEADLPALPPKAWHAKHKTVFARLAWEGPTYMAVGVGLSWDWGCCAIVIASVSGARDMELIHASAAKLIAANLVTVGEFR